MIDRSWMDAAACAAVTRDLWHADDAAAIDEARAICQGCAVLGACREHAIVNRERHGVWGGLTEQERRPLVRRHLVLHRSGERAGGQPRRAGQVTTDRVGER